MQAPLHSQQSPQRLATLRILLVRHGLSEDNQNSIWAGHKDSPLASAGVLQAKALGAALANYNLSAIYASDLKRASRTAEEILQVRQASSPSPPLLTRSDACSPSPGESIDPTAATGADAVTSRAKFWTGRGKELE